MYNDQNKGEREAFLAAFRARLDVFTKPRPDFDALTASDEELAALELPPRPDQAAEPALWDMWEKFFRPSVEYRTQLPELSPFNAERHHREAFQRTSPRQESSNNWAGAYVTPHHGRRFREIYGIWQVPEVTQPLGIPLPADGEYYSSIFIGLDGQRLYLDASLPQIGTRQNIDTTGNAVYETWFEWFERGQATWPTKLDLPVTPGDFIYCWMTVLGPSKLRAMIINLNTRWGQIVFARAPDIPLGSGLFRPRVSGATAEWIVERPTSAAGKIETLADYGQVDFEACLAVATRPSIGHRVHDLTGARLIRMLDQRESPHRSSLISRASAEDSTTLSVQYT